MGKIASISEAVIGAAVGVLGVALGDEIAVAEIARGIAGASAELNL